MTSIAVYNEYWETGGGGEMFCGGIAQALAEAGHQVTVLAHQAFDIEALSERLSLDLTRCTLSIVERGPAAVSAASAEHDLFVNGSYLSPVVNRAAHGLYVVHFPSRPWGRTPGRTANLYRSVVGSTDLRFEWGEGFHEPDGGGGTVWTSGEASITVISGADEPRRVNVLLGRSRPAAAGPADVEVVVDGEVQARTTIGGGSSTLTGRIRNRIPEAVQLTVPPQSSTVVTIRCNVFVPDELGLGPDHRTLGVRFHGIEVDSRLHSVASRLVPSLNHRLTNQDATSVFLRSYDRVASNSEFTRGYVESWWGIEDSPVLYPPVQLRPADGDKKRSIAAVGRFFGKDAGHSKKQLELVTAFRRLRGSGIEDWTLDLVGGVDQNARGYFDEVRRAAEGLPIRFHANAEGSVRDRVLSEASIFWHATGFGEDPERSPELMEHFGISTVEAMSSGSVPVVFAGGGQNEIVTDGAGFRWRTLDELVATTRRLTESPELLATTSAGAVARAQTFGFAAFADRLEAIVGEILDANEG
ncbi:glycosyltransferase [Actinospongicola halichondriae]|uniref:glycosyltransferase n=1 Tax=Actinospongicola halichondriae TaxID=3236844 RepID=UPI003D480703